MINEVISRFKEIYDSQENPRVFFSPGRVNLIGEYTDINGGHVLPCALKIGTYVAVRKREDQVINLFSANFSELGVQSIQLDKSYRLEKKWIDYPIGVLQVFADEGYLPDHGLDIWFYGNIPNSSGLSSSASIELAMCVVLNEVFSYGIDPITLVQYARRAENDFVGVKCGIMDQFIIGMGRENHAILLDTNNLMYEYAPLNLGDYVLLVANSNKKRGLADSKYNERFNECQGALKAIRTIKEVESLGSLTEEEFEELAWVIKNPVEKRRARHAVSENQRTLRAFEALKENRLLDFGNLMNASHLSLKEDFEVSGFELDTLVSLSQKHPGVIGSRMTGAGFGGCTVTLIHKNNVNDFIQEVGSAYEATVGYKADFYEVNIGTGARELSIE